MAGERRYLGIAEEDTFGTGKSAEAHLDFLSAQIDVPDDPFVTFEGAGSRAISKVVPGPYVPSGEIEIPVDLYTVGFFLKWLFGNWMTEGTDHDTPASTTLSSAVSAGDTTITVDDEAGFQVSDEVQLNTQGNEEPEIVQISALDGGAGPTYTWTLSEGAKKDHSSGAAVKRVQAPYKHIYWHLHSRNLPSFTLRVGKDFFEHTFLGTTVNSLSFSVERGYLTATLGLVAQKDQKDSIDVSPKSFPDELLYFGEGQTTINTDLTGGGSPTDVTSQVRSYSLEVNNNISEEDGVRHGSRFAQEFWVGGIDVSGTVQLVFKNTDEYERFWGSASGPDETSVNEFILEERFIVGAEYLALITTRAHYTQPPAPVEGRDRITQEMNFMGVDNADWLGPIAVWLNNPTPRY